MAKNMKQKSLIALVESEQKKFAKKVQKIQKVVKKDNEKPQTAQNEEVERGLVYLSHIPHGFFENEIQSYFAQFGTVTNVRVLRSKKTGRSKGAAFVEFEDADVGKIAAETMHNYLMFQRRIEAKYVPVEERHKSLFKFRISERNFPKKKAVSAARAAKNKNISREEHIKRMKKQLRKLHRSGQLDGVQVTHIDFPVMGIELNTLHSPKTNETKKMTDGKKVPMKARLKQVKTTKNMKKTIKKLGEKALQLADSKLVQKVHVISKRKANKQRKDE